MKKLVIFIFIFLSFGLLTSCRTINITDKVCSTENTEFSTNRVNDTDASESEDGVVYTIYQEGSFFSGSVYYRYDSANSVATDITVKVAEAENRKKFFFEPIETEKPANTPETYSVSIGGKTYSAPYLLSRSRPLSSNGVVEKNGVYNVYSDSQSGTALEVNATTGKIIHFYHPGQKKFNKEDTPESELTSMADAALLSFCGEKTASEYVYEGMEYTTNGGGVYTYDFKYRRYVWGLRTTECFAVSFCKNGDIQTVSLINFELYSSAEKEVKKSEVDTAISVLQSSLPESCEILSTSLILDSELDYYICATVKKHKNDEAYSTVYMNIK